MKAFDESGGIVVVDRVVDTTQQQEPPVLMRQNAMVRVIVERVRTVELECNSKIVDNKSEVLDTLVCLYEKIPGLYYLILFL